MKQTSRRLTKLFEDTCKFTTGSHSKGRRTMAAWANTECNSSSNAMMQLWFK